MALPQPCLATTQLTKANHSSQFITKFTCKLYCLLGIKITTSTAYHPQTDGQKENINQELKQYFE